jgi:hypothetical protein
LPPTLSLQLRAIETTDLRRIAKLEKLLVGSHEENLSGAIGGRSDLKATPEPEEEQVLDGSHGSHEAYGLIAG